MWDDERCGRSKEVNTPQLIGQRLGLGLLCWGFKGVQEEIPREEASTLQIGSVEFPTGQCTSQQIHPCHRLFDEDGHQDSSSASHCPGLAPCEFGYSLSSEAAVMRELRRWKRLWHAHTRGLPWGFEEVVGTVQQVHCSRRRLLRRELEYYVCTINKSALINDPRTYTILCIYIYIYWNFLNDILLFTAYISLVLNVITLCEK